MVNAKYLFTAGGLAVAAIVVFFLFFQSDTAKIKNCFSTLSKQAEKSGDEHELIAAAAARKIESLFAESVQIEIPAYDINQTFARNEIAPHVLYARSQYRDISLKFEDFDISFPEKGVAFITLSGILKATKNTGERVAETHELECRMKKIEGRWLLTVVRGVNALEK
ncbi:MAG: hypothetical protein M0Z56_07505 [Desulfobacteraceae bacterium]|nr:hypothetical protein [Desulfobacteraceae bacterium]